MNEKRGKAMHHEDILAKASDYRAGTLSPQDHVFMEKHLVGCSGCRSIVARWKTAAPPAPFTAQVMARLLGSGTGLRRTSVGFGRFSFWGSLAAAALVVAAFWRPEKGWVRSDQGFAVWDAPAGISAPAMSKEKRHD